MFTGSISRVQNIEGDSFLVERDDHKVVRVRLFDADCQALGKTAADSAKAVAVGLLEAKPFWIFPCGQAKGPAGDEVWACVWTAKGWLSEILIKNGYAQRRAESDLAALAPPDETAASSGPPPAAPAFGSASCTPAEAATFEVEEGGRKVCVRLFDITCEGIDASQQEQTKAIAARLAGAGGVWIFPCGSPKTGAEGDIPARIWGRGGWLSDALVKAGLAKRVAEPDKVASAAGPGAPAKKAEPAKKPAPAKTAPAPAGWREVPIPTARSRSASCNSGNFKIETPEWRLSWNLKPWRTGSPVSINVFRINEEVASGTTFTHVASFKGLAGSQIIRAKPGTFFIQVGGSPKLDVKAEVPE
jgi:hypothetical protein